MGGWAGNDAAAGGHELAWHLGVEGVDSREPTTGGSRAAPVGACARCAVDAALRRSLSEPRRVYIIKKEVEEPAFGAVDAVYAEKLAERLQRNLHVMTAEVAELARGAAAGNPTCPAIDGCAAPPLAADCGQADESPQDAASRRAESAVGTEAVRTRGSPVLQNRFEPFSSRLKRRRGRERPARQCVGMRYGHSARARGGQSNTSARSQCEATSGKPHVIARSASNA